MMLSHRHQLVMLSQQRCHLQVLETRAAHVLHLGTKQDIWSNTGVQVCSSAAVH
jgi:hypothetical protein